MLDRAEFVKTHPDVRTGMTVLSTTGEKLGVIEQIGDDNITVEKGRIFHKDFNVPFDDIEDVREDEVIIRERGEGFGETWEEREERYEEPVQTKGYAGSEVKVPKREREEEQARIPRREEELEAQKREKEGEVKVREDVRTETQRMEVPIQKEEVRVGKEARTEEQEVSGEVRKERVKVERKEPQEKK